MKRWFNLLLAAGKGMYFYIYYGDKWSSGTRIKIKDGDILGTSLTHWKVLMTNTTDTEVTSTVHFQVYSNGEAVTLVGNDLSVIEGGRLMLYTVKFPHTHKYYYSITNHLCKISIFLSKIRTDFSHASVKLLQMIEISDNIY